jgi:apolipoprotein N-acyltransferase
MDSRPEFARSLLLAAAAALVCGACFYFGTGVAPVWWLTWLAPLPVLLVAPRVPPLHAFLAGMAGWMLGSLNMVRYTINVMALPTGSAHWLGSALSIALFPALSGAIFGLAVVFFRGFARRGALVFAALGFAGVWTVNEYVTALVSPHGTFGSLVYSQMDVLPLMQVASLTGAAGIVFLMTLVPAAVAALAGPGRGKAALGASVAGLLVLVLAFGVWRLQPQAPQPSVKIAFVASDLPQNALIASPGHPTQNELRAYLARAQPLVGQGAQVVILPEKLGVTIPETAKDDDALLQSFADRNRVELVVGLIRKSGPDLLNEARLYTPGQAPRAYDKEHMLPRFESQLTPGVSRTLLARPSGLWGLAVCKDMDFAQPARGYGEDGIGLLLVPAWDFDDDAWLHDRMAVLRGVEQGFTIARAARGGLMTVSDDRGRILAQRASASAPYAALLADVPVHHDATLYGRLGDWFAWLASALLVFLLVAGLRRMR